jgi:flagellar hook assembly protein FlgD
MSEHRPHLRQPARRGFALPLGELGRVLVLALSLLALLLTSSAFDWVSRARAQGEAPTTLKRAVIVAGPVHSRTDRYRQYAEAIADAAAAQGMDVTRIFHPAATADKVKRHANGADLFVYVGHGNGWPSAYGELNEATKNGLGLDPSDPALRSPNTVVYKGADWLRANIQFAPNAVVILSHLSYASGNASSGMAIPTREVAVERIDNFANGFLASGARVVWALGWQPAADVIRALHLEDATMDAVFMTRYREGTNALGGWMGVEPGYYESLRTPGAQIHIDPDPANGYLRAVSGDLAYATTQWRDMAAAPLDTVPPVISEVSITQAAATIASEGPALPIFTPNGDGVTDSVKISHALSENAFLDIRVSQDDHVVREMSVWALGGRGSTTWDGRRDDGTYVGEGRFRIQITPTDRAGNVGVPAAAKVLVLNVMRAPTVKPELFYPSDGDALAATSVLRARLSKPATVSWLIKDAAGTIVRHGPDTAAAGPGQVRFAWDGRDDAAQPLPDGRYTARARVTRPQGSYAHDVAVRLMPFGFSPSAWRVARGEFVRVVFESAEPLTGKPVVTFDQPGLDPVPVRVIKIGPTTFKAAYTTKQEGKLGKLTVRAEGTDTGGGIQSQSWALKLR